MIARRAVERYLERELTDSRVLWRASPKALEELVSRLDPPAKFHTKPHWYQLATFLLNIKYPGYLDYLDPGLGKTKVAYDTFRYRRDMGQCSRMLTLVPSIENIDEWIREARIHAPDLTVVGLTMTGADARIETLNSAADVVVATYMGFLSLVTRKGKGKWTPHRPQIRRLARILDFLTLDECTFVSGHDSKFHRACLQYANECGLVIGLTGTPYDSSPHDVFGQFRVADGGVTFGRHLGLFRETFFHSAPAYRGRGQVWTFNRSRMDDFRRFMANRSFRVTTKRAGLKVPSIGGLVSGKGLIIKDVIFSAEQLAYHKRIMEALRAAEGDPDKTENAYVRLRQLTSGYLAVNTEEGDRVEVVFKHNPKLERLLACLKEIPKGRKVVVFYWLKRTGLLLEERLRKEGIKCGRIAADVPKGRRLKAKGDFLSGKLRVLLGNQALAFGNNLQSKNGYAIFYEGPSSPLLRLQEERRIARQGLEGTATIWDLVVRNSIDVRVVKALVAGHDLYDQLINARKRRRKSG